MKVGILSMQRVINYGSFLQSYCLKSMIQSLGYDVHFIDIRQGKKIVESEDNLKSYFNMLFKQGDRSVVKRVEHFLFEKKRRKLFEQWQSKIGITTPIREEECDAVIIGSDEVFNCAQFSTWGYTTQLYGNVACKKVASYAATFANTSFLFLKNNKVDSEIGDLLSNLYDISVRDDASKECVHQLCKLNAHVHLDPVLVHDLSPLIPDVEYDNFILVYAYDNRICDQREIAAIKKLAKKYNKEIYSFGMYQHWCKNNIIVDPFTLLGCFKKADFVITDTFHGTIMAAKTHSSFATIIRPTNQTKLNDLVTRLGLNDRVIDQIDKLEDLYLSSIDFSQLDMLIQKETEKTKAYLEHVLNDNR